jgi:hypothetical protein
MALHEGLPPLHICRSSYLPLFMPASATATRTRAGGPSPSPAMPRRIRSAIGNHDLPAAPLGVNENKHVRNENALDRPGTAGSR